MAKDHDAQVPMPRNSADSDEKVVKIEEFEAVNPSRAFMVSNKPNPWGPGYKKLYCLAALIFLCSTMNGKLSEQVRDVLLTIHPGFDGSLMGSINALPNYIEYYDLPDKGTTR
jgi:hypothetical protein